MIVEKFKSNIVAHLSYFIGSEGEALVVDPQRDCLIYLNEAQRNNMSIKYIFETHRNEDFIIGSRELAHLSGAKIYHGPWPTFQYGDVLIDGQEFKIGKLKVTAIYTPGHTPGCVSYAVTDLESGQEAVLVCTGDTLFVNDVGRTDFGGSDKRREWSVNLYNSIFHKLLPLGDQAILCPAHGAGSVCGSNIALREWSTLGLERMMNPFLQLSQEEFVEYKVKEHHEYAPYFKLMEKYNIEGAPFLGAGKHYEALPLDKFTEKMNEGAVVLDLRSPAAFGGAHIKGSYSIPPGLLSFTGWFISFDKPIITVIDNDSKLDSLSSLARIGYDNVVGYLGGGLASWYSAGYPLEASKHLITASDLKSWLDSGKECFLLDTRSKDEFDEGHIKSATHIYLGHLQERIDEIPRTLPIMVVCGSGNRASVATSILLRNGYEEVYNFLGAMKAWRKLGYPLSQESP
jgi:hydroxyacylglutathione hydrolase